MLSQKITFDFYYLSFLIMYILCIVFIYQKYSEIIAFFVTFIVHTTFLIFIGKDISTYITQDSMFLPKFIALSLGIACIFQFISLILIIQLILSLRKKYTVDKGTPIYLPKNYKKKLEIFKLDIIISFIIGFFLLCILYLRFDSININFLHLIKNISISTFFGNFSSVCAVILGTGMIGITSYQVYLANDILGIKNNQVI